MVAVELKGRTNLWSLDDTLNELDYLARTAGAEVVGRITQRANRLTSLFLGKGKIQEVKERAVEWEADTVIFDDELTPSQQRNLEEALGTKVIDRTALILDVFARHARTYEGQLQVELAQHKYLLPRLAGQWSHLERLGGGIGTRGPGETQLETDRRLVRRRIGKIEGELEGVRRRRTLYMGRRKKASIPIASLVGYTNAGKSTLFNALSDARVDAEDQLFSTLDPVTRRIRLPSGGQLLLTDTVGFIQKLSPMVVAAFRATLEELAESDILLHVIDITHAKAPEQTEVVETVLKDLGLADQPRLLVINKMDLLEADSENVTPARRPSWDAHSSVLISAAKGWNLDLLLQEIESRLLASGSPSGAGKTAGSTARR
ncbi:MAG: GTPase HflX [Dehalococcoidia bacterium]|nr:GTPase HflX [Dehalococcoidia bacterium]MDP7085147.1 GTPase HflX [Dehalococcoidia bacterium]HJN86715.1 GTPase HflX [Dehalococcoidia bacterium]